MKITSVYICAFLVVLFHVVGLWGFLNPEYTSLFKKLVPFHLLLMLVLMVLSHQDRNRYFWIFLASAYTAGFVIELLGVNTGAIFGDYTYGATLGPKFAEIPLLIGVNWILVIYSTGVFLKQFKIKNHIIRALIGAFLVTALDVLIEPVAIKFDYWSWENLEVPFQNYVGWFAFSFLMMRFFFLMKFHKTNLAAVTLFVVQFLFFLLLNIKAV